MKILIIGDWPKINGGVVNYTRPLAIMLQEQGHDVSYLYSNASRSISTFGKPQIKEDFSNNFNFKSYCFSNGKILLRNYDNSSLEVDPWMNKVFAIFLKKIKPKVVHINEIFGFSSNIIKVCYELKIPVIVTVHEYWWLCSHRVMVDYNRQICEGPDSLEKCTYCVSKKLENFNRSRILTRQRINYYFPSLLLIWKKLESITKKIKSKKEDSISDILQVKYESFENHYNPKLKKDLEKRLEKNIEMLNLCSLIIGVSNDVKNKLTNYGVNESKIIVQHIGSLISEKKIKHTKALNDKNIVFGFIGGVGYYKGVHLIAEAYKLLPERLKEKCSIKIFGKGDLNYINAIKEKYNLHDEEDNFVFHGKFTAGQIPEITNQIDITILPSLCADTAPQTIFESYSAQLPVIGPNIGGFPDFIEDNVNGLLFKPGDSASLANCMSTVLENPSLISSFKKEIPELKKLNQNVMELIAIYEKVKV